MMHFNPSTYELTQMWIGLCFTIGYCIFLDNSSISWKSKKKSAVSHSSTEAKYHSMAHTIAELVWLCRFLIDFDISISNQTPLHCDNKSAVNIAENEVFHKCLIILK